MLFERADGDDEPGVRGEMRGHIDPAHFIEGMNAKIHGRHT
jgi:hypothetical protein